MATSTPPLADLRVLDLTLARAGPTAVRQLADWGADVVRIERPTAAAETTSRGRDLVAQRLGSDFQNLHRNKRCLALDLKRPEGMEVFHRLVEGADILIENMRPAVKYRLGIDYDSLSAIQPRLIYGSISGFGQSGPYGDRGGVDQIAQGMSGLMSVTGPPDGEPTRTGAAITDIASGLYLATGILAAVHQRHSTGHGQWVHTSLLEAGLGLLDFQAARYLVEGEVAGRTGNHHPTLPPMGLFPTRDGYLNLAGVGQRMFEALCAVLEADELVTDPRFATAPARLENRAALELLVAERTRLRDTDELVTRLNQATVPAGPVYSIDQTFADQQVQYLGIAKAVEHPKLGNVQLLGQPVHLNAQSEERGNPSFSVRRLAPEQGEHSREILTELGLTSADIDALIQNGTVFSKSE